MINTNTALLQEANLRNITPENFHLVITIPLQPTEVKMGQLIIQICFF